MKTLIHMIGTGLLAFAMWMATGNAQAQGWPENYGGVMLQGFYWDSYNDSRWTVLESQADELAEYFNLMWVPNSAYPGTTSNNMGYHPIYWFDHKSAFGTEAQLRSMIKTLSDKGLGVIEDVVINHRLGVSNWVDFPKETYKGVSYQLGLSDICKDDECKDNGYKPTGAADTGMAWDYARDLDHTSDNVQTNVKAYLDCLLNDLGYVGFRYDFVKGYAAKYIGIYNTAAKPQFSVGECWDGTATIKRWIDGTKVDGTPTSAAFDFQMKYNINDAFGSNKWSNLKTTTITRDANYARYSVTFVDNHDTARPGESPLNSKVEAANAYILVMPGTPCVFLRHWQMYKTAIKKLIYVRHQAGITNQSTIVSETSQSSGFALNVKGEKGSVLAVFGTVSDVSTDGYKLATEGSDYKVYVSNDTNIDGIDKIKSDEDSFSWPDFCTVNDGETCAFFEAPSWWGSQVNCWRWDKSYNYTGNKWPGVSCELVGTATNGNKVWKWTAKDAEKVAQSSTNEGIIFNDGSNQTADLQFTNGAYYNYNGLVAGIAATVADKKQNADPYYYTLSGQRVAKPTQRGVYIHQGRKIVVK